MIYRLFGRRSSLHCNLSVPHVVQSLLSCAGSRDKQVFIWDPEEAVPVQKLQGHKWQVTDVAIAGDGTIFSSSLDGCASWCDKLICAAGTANMFIT